MTTQNEQEITAKIKDTMINTGFKSKEAKHFMPNEIFEDLQANISKSPHVAFAYSYYYLTSWLYRNAKYGEKLPININTKTIKQLLGYTPTNKTLNYIIKKEGTLDTMGYTKNDWDYPVHWSIEDKQVRFTTISDVDDQQWNIIHGSRRTDYEAKYPVKHFYRDPEDMEIDELTGVFNDVSDTHMVPFEAFMQCMSIDELGTTGFYLFSYLKKQNQHFVDGYDASLDRLSRETGIPRMSINRYITSLKEYNLIKVVHNQEFFSLGIKAKDRLASTYITSKPTEFTRKVVEYEKLKVKKKAEYLAELESNRTLPEEVKISLEELPF